MPAACGPAPARAGGWWWGLVGHGGGPEEAGEFAGDGDGGEVAGLVALAEALVEAVEAALCAQRDLDDVVRLARASFGERGSDARLRQVAPGRFHEQPSRVAGAGLGDCALPAALAGLVERGHESEPAGQLRWPREPCPVADL